MNAAERTVHTWARALSLGLPRHTTQRAIRDRAYKIRICTVAEARLLPPGRSVEEPRFHKIFRSKSYQVSVAKPGKEADSSRGTRQNLDDMRPCVFHNGQELSYTPGFVDVFRYLEQVGQAKPEALEIIACLLVRCAFMCDHTRQRGRWRYHPPVAAIRHLDRLVTGPCSSPCSVFLHYLNGLAWNEDVKYDAKGKNLRAGTGRQNTLMTIVNWIALLLGYLTSAELCAKFLSARGVAPVSLSQAIRWFPMLRDDH